MNRYNLRHLHVHSEDREMLLDPDGEWVRYEDMQRHVGAAVMGGQ